jgi:hypothetical protein
MKKSVIGIILLITILCMIVPVFAVNVTEAWNASYDGGTGSSDIANDVAVDSSGNVYVTGYSNLGTNDYYTIKYDSSGNHVWNVSYDNDNDQAQAIAVDSSGNVYVTGYYYSGGYYDRTIKYNSSGDEVWGVTYSASAMAFDVAVDSSKNVYVIGILSNDYYTVKYNSSGDQQWNVSYDSGDTDKGVGITVDSNSNVYVTGSSDNGVNRDYYTIKYDSSGNHVWNATYNGGEDDWGYGIAVDSSGNVYVIGESEIGGDSAGYRDYYTIKYDSSGNHVWNATYNGGSDDRGTGIAVDSSGDVYVTGYSEIGGDANSDRDYYTIKYNSSGDQQWNITYNGGTWDAGFGIAVDSSNNVYVTGRSENAFNSTSDHDYFTIKYSQSDGGGNTTQDHIEGGLSDLNLSYSSGEIAELESLYNNATGSVTIGNETWYYTGDAMAGRSIGEGWEENGYYYIKLGSGISTEAQGGSGGESNGTGYVNVSITTTLAIEVIQEDIDFGEGAVDAGESNAELYTNQANAPTQNRGNWTLPNAYAIEVRNVGNINCSLDVGSSKTASSFIGGTNPEYQWKVSDKEAGSCSGGLTHSVWYDVNSSARLCQHLSPINSSDEIFLDIRVVVPYDANPTDSLVHKTDILTLTASAVA